MLKRTGHGVLAADRCAFQLHLCLECTEQSGERFAPALGVCAGALKVFLEGQPALVPRAASRYDLCNGFNHRVHCAVIG